MLKSQLLRLALLVLSSVLAGCWALAPEQCSDRIVFNHSCGGDSNCGEYMCFDSNGEECLDGPCTKMCTKHCGSAVDCPQENGGIVLESACKSGICVATKCEIKEG